MSRLGWLVAMNVQPTNPETVSTPVPFGELLRPLFGPTKRHWRLLVATIVAGWGKFLLPALLPILTAVVVDRLLAPAVIAEVGAEALLAELMWYAVGAAVVVALVGVSTYYRHALAQRFAARLQHHLRKQLFSHIQHLSMSFFHRHHAGALGARVSSDITHAGVVVERGVIQVGMDLTASLVIGALMVWTHPTLSLIAIAFLVINVALIVRFSPRIRRQRKSIQESQSSVTGRAAEIFAGISVVKAYSGEQSSSTTFAATSRVVFDRQYENSTLQGRFSGLSFAVMLAAQVTLVLIGTALILHGHALTAGGLLAMLGYVTLVNGSMQRLTESMLQIQDGFAALERIHDILAITPNPDDVDGAIEPTLSGQIRFRDLCFSYGDQPVIHHLDTSFEAGRSYAFVGPSGSGKSTLIQLLLRFYDPSSGAVEADGIDLRQIRQAWYRSHVAVVMQDPILFSGTLAENIGFAADSADQAAIESAARKAQAHDFITSLPDGYQSRVGERGVTLSGGQRQRVAIARALMRDPKMLILDEATSALDSVTERSIQEVIDHLQGSRTLFVIAHRLSTVRNVDEILVIDGGQIAERGSYQDLLARGGAFARLVAEQADQAAAG